MAAQFPAVFQFHTHAVRIFPSADGLSFVVVAKDVADILGYETAKDFLRQVPDTHKGRQKVPTPSGEQEMLVVDEPGLYRGILRSNRREAEPLMEWVTGDVLPSIRRTGGYGQPAMPATHLDLAREIGALRDELRAQNGLIFDLYGKLDGARRGHIAAQRGQLAAVRALHTLRAGQAVQEGIDTVISMMAAGIPREEIARATGKTRNYIRQIIYDARKDGRLPQAHAAQGRLSLEG